MQVRNVGDHHGHTSDSQEEGYCVDGVYEDLSGRDWDQIDKVLGKKCDRCKCRNEPHDLPSGVTVHGDEDEGKLLEMSRVLPALFNVQRDKRV